MLEKPLKILVSIPTCKEPESLHSHPYSKVKLDKLKSNNNTWNHEKFEVSGQSATPESGGLGKSRESRGDCSPAEKLLESQTDMNTFNGIVGKLLQTARVPP